ncbi:PREDICTED: glucokinase-like [Cyprinodon variegatus]|uniref:glucokinase-like n=1 Tax=Cyprinodon variegatus TaxID=28743 RepID=UPI0007429825|nr:PREDICTED: glucokinase-like [Cyprinodon variegatus]
MSSAQVLKYLEPFRLSLEKLREISAQLKKDMIRGLGKHTHNRAPVKMLPTFVRETPDGKGTGTNACYMEEMKNVKRVEGEDGRMCINTEWGGFGDDGSLEDILTEFDKVVDKTSINPGVHMVRLVLVKLTEEKLLFKGGASEALLNPGRFETKFISEIEEPDRGLENVQKILTKLDLKWDLVDACVVRLVCDTISSRSARLCAAGLATIANRIRVNRGLDHLKTTVGVDGTVYRKHPNFSDELQAAVRLLAPKCEISFLVSEDGSGKGAAMVAAVAQRLAVQSHLLDDSDGEDEDEEEEDEEDY